ncbi:biotin/lipoyl-containing protein [Pedobacter xixiisoli]|uniref:Biotin carboxyl carrier protein n=1 Tax=Pedobacter xixiisoli TaxID=1476464 RepID=A0A286AE20_9SPHI|nr:acetyl-CoA carboxylase biotin carboxyl carrier protein subunit [Pedobacter xixiisoli]SOD20144.1 biotin carboxyl carrier protein [Pedobacter xixiisoli]
MNKVTVNSQFHFDVDVVNEVLQVNSQSVDLDVLSLNEKSSHILHKSKSYNVEVVEFDKAEKLAKIKVNGTEYQVQVTTQLDLLLKQLGLDNLNANKIAQIKAPMPGLVLNILVKEGDEVKKGDSLVVLEAMKMENIIKSPADAIIKKIEVKQGDKIEKNTVLIQFG